MEIPIAVSQLARIRTREAVLHTNLNTLSDKLGIDVAYREKWNGPQWTTKQLVINPRDPAAYFFHEIIHWIVATPEERGMFNYGLGQDDTFSVSARARTNVFQGQTIYDGAKIRFGFKNSPLVSRERANDMETLAVDGFLLLPVFTDISVVQSWNYWGEFSGGYNRTSRTNFKNEINASLRQIVAKFREHGISVKKYLLTTGY